MKPGHRLCTVCGVEKPLQAEFHRATYGRAGRAAVCKDCRSAYRRGHYAKQQGRPIRVYKKNVY